MKHLLTGLLGILVVLVCLSGTTVKGQSPRSKPKLGPGWRPNLSPYLNLIRGGNSAANYYLGVRPEIERRQDEALFRQDINTLNDTTGVLGGRVATNRNDLNLAKEDLDLLRRKKTPTVRQPPIQFNTTGNYYNNTGGFYPRGSVPARR